MTIALSVASETGQRHLLVDGEEHPANRVGNPVKLDVFDFRLQLH